MFTVNFVFIILLTFIIHCIDTSSYALRMAGAKTGKVAISAALFNFLFLFSRTATSLQIPLLTKWVEKEILGGGPVDISAQLHVLIGVSTIGTVAGALLIPVTQRLLHVIVGRIASTHSVIRSLFYFMTNKGREEFRNSPVKEGRFIGRYLTLPVLGPKKALAANTLAIAFLTISGFSTVVAATLTPELRGTSVSLFSMLNGISTVISIVFVLPSIAIFVDETRDETINESSFHNFIAWLIVSRIAGTLLAHAALDPTARFANFISHII
jgi:hypothetical protein